MDEIGNITIQFMEMTKTNPEKKKFYYFFKYLNIILDFGFFWPDEKD